MNKRLSIISPEIKEILREENHAAKLKDQFEGMHPYDIFILCEDLEDAEVAACVKALGRPDGIELFEQFDDERKGGIFEHFSADWMADVLEEMAPDERADFVKTLPEVKLEKVFPLIARAERIDIKKLIEYKEGTAGSILTTEYASLSPEVAIPEAIERLKRQAFDRETIYYVYVVDENRKLTGFISLRDILLSPSTKKIKEVMHPEVIRVRADEDKELVAQKFKNYDLLAIPVVDEEERLVGIVTVDDVMDVMVEETTEDMYKYAAAGEYVDYMKANSFDLAKQRTFWLLVLIFVEFIASWVLKHNSAQLQAVVALSFFIPLLLGSGGNAGTQSSTAVVRGLATGDIKMDDVFQILKKELWVGGMVGTAMAVLAAIRAFWFEADSRIGITVGLAMVATVILGTTLGAFLPILFKRMKLDPALMSGPFITSIVDIVSLLIYFRIAAFIFQA